MIKRAHDNKGWRYKVVDSTIEQIHEVLKKQKLTFVEQQVIISWLQCYLVYELGKVSANDVFGNIKIMNEKIPEPPKNLPGVS